MCRLTADGKELTLDMHEKWSTSILKELMEVAGGNPWAKWKAEAKAAGLPVVPGEEGESLVVKRPTPVRLPSLNAYRASLPPPSAKPTPTKDAAPTGTKAKADAPIPPPKTKPKTGAAAVLP